VNSSPAIASIPPVLALGLALGSAQDAPRQKNFAHDTLQVGVVVSDLEVAVKPMELPDVEPKPSDNAFIHSQLGFRYLTIGVRDIDAALERLRAAGGKPLAKGPVRLGERPESEYLVLVRDPDGNLIELIGAKR